MFAKLFWLEQKLSPTNVSDYFSELQSNEQGFF